MKKNRLTKTRQQRRNILKKNMLCSIVLFVSLMLQVQGNRINVPDDFAKIQDAINSSVDGDTILVAPGRYIENINFRGKNILLSSLYLLDEDIQFINSTIIDGSNPQFADTASVVLFLSNESRSAILQGFTILGGKGTKIFDIEANFWVRVGGGILIYHASPTIRHNVITLNESINQEGVIHNGGGGISVHISSTLISNNIMCNNNANDGGGAVLGPNPGAIFRNNIIAYNETKPTGIGGGGLFLHGPLGEFKNNTIAFNRSAVGGGIVVQDNAVINIANCIIYGNTTGSSSLQIEGSGTFNINHTDIKGGWPGTGNRDEDPLFVDYTALLLQEGSPCVDKGDTNIADNDWEDPDNLGFALPPALGTLRNDMGAYGGNQFKSMPYKRMLDPRRIIIDNSQNQNHFIQGDTVVLSSRIVSPEDQAFEVLAVFKKSDGSIVDSVIMLDDGSLKDSLIGDGLYTGAWLTDSVNRYYVDISVHLLEYDEQVTLRDVFHFTTESAPTSIEDENGTLPDILTLNQNFPNPFTQTTTIGYSISRPANVSLKVYDMLGNEVKTLVNEHQNTGSYATRFDASSLPAGVYFYKMTAGEFSITKRLTRIK